MLKFSFQKGHVTCKEIQCYSTAITNLTIIAIQWNINMQCLADSYHI